MNNDPNFNLSMNLNAPLLDQLLIHDLCLFSSHSTTTKKHNLLGKRVAAFIWTIACFQSG